MKGQEQEQEKRQRQTSFTEPHGRIRPGKEGIFSYTEVLQSTYR